MALRNWLQDRKERTILKDTVDFAQKVLETVHEFERAFDFLAKEKNKDVAYNVFERVLKLEHEADGFRRNLLMALTKSEFGSQMRQDFMILIKRIDKIANEADKASRILLGLQKDMIYTLGDTALDLLGEIIHRTVEATKILYGLIKRMTELEDEEVFRITNSISSIEHECDKLHTAIFLELTQQKIVDVNPFVVVQLGKFIDTIEHISNRIEDVCDYIELVKTLESTRR